MNNLKLSLGIDVGSTTVKLTVVDSIGKPIYSCYKRHNAKQLDTVKKVLEELKSNFPNALFRISVCGSGGKPVAQILNVHYIQEVVANAAAVRKFYSNVHTAIELGGQDAKVIFFHDDAKRGKLMTSDMRMNGSCAGGTGAFIDEVASMLDVSPEDFEKFAEKGTTLYDISGRCGVFAKTDIQPLLIQGALKEDIAISTFHSIVKQTIGGLSQGLELKPPIIFEGGPLTFNPTLIRVFAERLNLKSEDIIIPEHPETIVSLGTACAAEDLFEINENDFKSLDFYLDLLNRCGIVNITDSAPSMPFFKITEEKELFVKRHNGELKNTDNPLIKNNELSVFIGIDSGSTTSKIVLIDENENVIDTYYANNHGKPIDVVKKGLLGIKNKYKKQGVILKVLGAGTTGYGEQLFAKVFGADYHTVETVAHTQACLKFVPNASFLLDIGGQDMKAIWMKDGVITNIMLNEACSSGCGSFLENFAATLNIPAEKIADAAFSSKSPAKLGSRCTVFMNSTIINEQRNGKTADDIMAGLCRSIIENVFTKVVRISNTDELGSKIVVQGGTFRNFAVLRALEEYVGKEVILAPYPGEMGALGAALLAKKHIAENGYANGKNSSFLDLENIDKFTYTTKIGLKCTKCANHCSRTVMEFSNGSSWVTGNKCDRGAMTANETTPLLKKVGTDLYSERYEALFKDYDFTTVSLPKDEVIGILRVLEFWESMPFWTTFFHALGYKTVILSPSNRKNYEGGLQFVASDTICFPAKLVHGHILDLCDKRVDRIFMPYIMHMPPEGLDKLSPYVCPIVMGYPMVVKNSQSPEKRYGIPFDTPVFHWFTEKDRKMQIISYAVEHLKVNKKEAEQAFVQGKTAIEKFHQNLYERGKSVIDLVNQSGEFAIVLAGRPYHNDKLVNHRIAQMFTQNGISVLTLDSLPNIKEVDLKKSRVEITNNFHTRMLAGSVIAGQTKCLEYVQIVSFGCGHDAILSDEIVRLLNETGNKSPLILKVDESDASGSLEIRIRSFIESVKSRRQNLLETYDSKISDAYPAKFLKTDKKERTLLIPNISSEVSLLLKAIMKHGGFNIKTVPIGSTQQIKLGKKYVHNDICFPCQMVIGELISELQKGNYKQDEVAVGMIKFQCDCRMSNYAALLRKGLDSSGFKNIPILTTDVNDTKNMHQGVNLFSIKTVLEAIWVFMMIDILKSLTRQIRPYEVNEGESDRVLSYCVSEIALAIQNGISSAKKEFKNCIKHFQNIKYDRSNLKPRVFITGELLVTYHPGSNFNIERYLEKNGMETIFPRVTDQLRKDFLAQIYERRDFNADVPAYPYLIDKLFDHIQFSLEKTAVKHPLYKANQRPRDCYLNVQDIIPSTLSCGEGWLMAAEIAHYAKNGVKSFVILQPFGCLPNHICGRGVIKRLKEDYSDIQILPLDLDPDTSFANTENRLQMLIMNSKNKTEKQQ